MSIVIIIIMSVAIVVLWGRRRHPLPTAHPFQQLPDQRSQRGQAGQDHAAQMLQDGADGRVRQRVGVIVREDAAQGDRLGDGTRGRQAAQAHEHAERGLGARVQVQPVQDDDGDGGAGEVGEGVEPEANVAGQVGDMAGETVGPPLAHEGDVPDGAHGPALDNE